MIDAILAYLEQNEGPLAYLVLAASAGLEYALPPFPGDTIVLFGVFLSAHAGYSIAWVYASVTAGSIGGSLISYALGRWLGKNPERWPRFLRNERSHRAIEALQARFERHGGLYLAVNRFVPALRAFFFIAAGMAGMDIRRVILFGGISALLWNGLVIVLGYALGRNWETLLGASRTYTIITVAIFALVVVIVWLIRRRRSRSPSTGQS